MQKKFSARVTLLFALLLILGLSAACRAPSRTSTPVPPTVKVSPTLPPAPTAPPLTAAPTDLPTAVPTESLPPPATNVNPTNSPAPAETAPAIPTIAPQKSPGSGTNPTRVVSNNPPAPTAPVINRGPLTGLSIAGMRTEPPQPRNNEQTKFYATIVNRSGRSQTVPVCVEIFRVGVSRSIGVSSCDAVTVPQGTTQVFGGMWIGSGIKQCTAFRARAGLRPQGELLPFTTTSGRDFWFDFPVCP